MPITEKQLQEMNTFSENYDRENSDVFAEMNAFSAAYDKEMMLPEEERSWPEFAGDTGIEFICNFKHFSKNGFISVSLVNKRISSFKIFPSVSIFFKI